MSQIQELPLELIRLSPYNTRGEILDEDLESLVQSIRETGLVEPLKVRTLKDGAYVAYELVSGERRLRALQILDAEYAACIVKDMTDEEVLLEQWAENEEREDISDYGKARKLRQMLDALKISQRDLAQRLGKHETWVSQHLSILKLEKYFTRVKLLWSLSEKQARAILSAPDEDVPAVCAEVERYCEEEESFPSAADIVDFIKGMQSPGIQYVHDEEAPETGPAKDDRPHKVLPKPARQEPGESLVLEATGHLVELQDERGVITHLKPPQPRATPEEIYATIHDLYTRFETPNTIFVIRLLQQKHGLSHEEAQQAHEDYKKNRQLQPPSPVPAPAQTPETKATEAPTPKASPKEPIVVLVEVLVRETPDGVGNITWRQKIPVKIMPGQNLEITVDGDLVHQEEAVEPPEYQDEEEQETLASESEAQARAENEDREWEEHEREEEEEP